MSHHLLAFAGSVANNVTNTAIPRLTDGIFSNTGSGYTFPTGMRPIMGYVGCDSITGARINSPTLRLVGPQQIWPLSNTALPVDNPPLDRWMENARLIPGNDFFNIEVTRAGAGAFVTYGLLWMAPNPPVKDRRPVCSVVATSATTIAAATWAPGTITFTDALPPGRYAVVGCSAFGTNLLAARFFFPNQVLRPGCLAQGAATEFDFGDFANGNLGVWGEFENESPPVVEFMGTGAGAAQTLIIDLVPLSTR
jgi:hypothetical protein